MEERTITITQREYKDLLRMRESNVTVLSIFNLIYKYATDEGKSWNAKHENIEIAKTVDFTEELLILMHYRETSYFTDYTRMIKRKLEEEQKESEE